MALLISKNDRSIFFQIIKYIYIYKLYIVYDISFLYIKKWETFMYLY